MKAIVLNKPGEFVITDLPRPALAPDEVLIEIKASGICTNDVRDFNGDCNYSYPRIGGHEYAGVIAEMGDAVNKKRFAVGQRVVTYIIDNCGECYYCKSGQENICVGLPQTTNFQNPDGISGYGGFGEFVTAKAEDLFVYPEDTSFEQMAFTEPLACVLNSINRTPLRFGDDVLVIGGGAMGLLHVMALKLKGCKVFLSEPLAERREKALSLGCDGVIDPVAEDAVAKIKAETDDRGAVAVYNTTAHPAIAAQAVEMMAPGGTCVMFSSIHPNEPVPVNMGYVHSFQTTITGAVSPTVESYREAVKMIADRLLDPTVLTDSVYDYRDFAQAIKRAGETSSYKVLLTFGEE